MEKNRIQPIKSGTGMRISYARQDDVLEVPNLIEIQKDSYEWFLREGLAEVFEDISPIEDYSDQLSLEFVDYQLCKDDIKYSIEECKERDATYAAPLKVQVRLHNKETDEIAQRRDIFMGDLPLMTETGTFMESTTESHMIRSERNYILPRSFRTEVPGWNMRQIPTMYLTCVSTVQERFRSLY